MGLVLVLVVALRVIGRHYARYRLAHREDGRGKPWPLPRMPLRALDPAFETDPVLGYSQNAEAALICLGPESVVGATSDYEAWILSVLARFALTMFEFGTCTGRTAYLWARNSPPNARVFTLTLDPVYAYDYRPGAKDDPQDQSDALTETFCERYLYTGTAVECKVTQLYGDSKAFDATQFSRACDLIFVDGSHARSYVASDSEKALQMIKPGGLILWHDYRGPHRSSGVFETLNELGKRLPLTHIEGTSLVLYRAPAVSAAGI